MNIALLGNKSFDGLEFHMNDSLSFLGHSVYHIDMDDVVKIPYRYNYWLKRILPVYDRILFQKIALNIINQAPDLIICTYRFIPPSCIIQIKKALPNTPIVHVNPDQLITFEDQQIFASPYDAYFTKDTYILNFMKNKMGLNTFYLPESFNQRIHKMPENLDRISLENEANMDVVAFGTMYPYRANILNEIIKDGIKVDLFGTQDKKFPNPQIVKNFRNEYITGVRKAEILFGAKIVFNNFHYGEVDSVNVKFFEISGIGAFQICDYKPAVLEYTKIDIEKFTFKNINEAKEKIKYYLDRPYERHALAEEQRKHFLVEHTYDVRMQFLLSTVG